NTPTSDPLPRKFPKSLIYTYEDCNGGLHRTSKCKGKISELLFCDSAFSDKLIEGSSSDGGGLPE
ncbi:MAG TPA: hypothetical protein VGA03_02215, partial [Anaerolineales bacterium]